MRTAVLVIPVMAAVAVATATSRMLPSTRGGLDTAMWWTVVITASTLALLLVERQARRLLPLAALFKLTLLFPDRAPSRLRVALRAGTVRHLEQRLEQGRRDGVGRDPSQAASNILVLVTALSRHDRRTRGHSERVRLYAQLLGEELHLSDDERDRLRWASLLHDVGKVRVRPEILNKPGSLSAEEWAVIHRHPSDGARMAAPLSAWLGPWMAAIEQHHERWDGGGYPRGLAGQEIAMSGRIVAVADAFEVMTAPRSYRRPMGAAAARDELARCAGSHFDPAVVRAFLNVSIGRLRWVMAPIAWLTDLPFVRPVAQAGTAAESATAAVAAKAFAAISLAVLAGTVLAPPPFAAPTVGLTAGQPEQAPEPAAQTAAVVPASAETTTSPPPPPAPSAPSVTQPPTPASGPARTATPVTSRSTSAPKGGAGAPGPANPAPAAGDDTASVPAGKSVKIDVLGNDADADGLDTSTLAVVGGPAHGQAQVNGQTGSIRYTADSGYVGGDVFQYRVCDTKGACSVAAVRITVLP